MGLIFGSAAKTEVMPFDKVKEVNKLEASVDNFIYLKSRILTCDEPNGNGDFLPAAEVKKSYRTFIGKIVDYNHDTTQILGKIIDADYIEGKNGEHDSVDIICKIDKTVYPQHIMRITNGELHQMSMEAYADNAQCGFCGSKFPFADPCEHIKGSMNKKLKAADGKEVLVHRVDLDLTFVGAGIVENPADKNAQVDVVIASEEKNEIKKLKSLYSAVLNCANGILDINEIGEYDEEHLYLTIYQDNPHFEQTKEFEEKLRNNGYEIERGVKADGDVWMLITASVETKVEAKTQITALKFAIGDKVKLKEPNASYSKEFKNKIGKIVDIVNKSDERNGVENAWKEYVIEFPNGEYSTQAFDLEKVEAKSTDEILKEINAFDFMRIVDAVNNIDSGKINEIVTALEVKITEPIFSDEISKFLDKRLTSIELNEVKGQLMKKGKLIGKQFGAHLINLNNEDYWLITSSGMPLFKYPISGIWGEDLKNPEIKVEGMVLADYAKSETFKRRLLAVIQTEGIDYIKAKWGIISDDNKNWLDVINLSAADVEKWKKTWEGYGDFDTCVSKVTNTDINNPQAYCAWLEKTATGKYPTQAAKIEASKDEMAACVKANMDNKQIAISEGQTKEDAIEAHCFKKVMGIKASITVRDLVDFDLVNDKVLGGKANFKAYLDYRLSGHWPIQSSKAIRIKMFAKEFNKLSKDDQKVFYQGISGASLTEKALDMKVHILASPVEVERLLKHGMTEVEILELHNKRFGG